MEAELHWALQGVPTTAGTSTTGESPERKALSKPSIDSKDGGLSGSSIIRMRMLHGSETLVVRSPDGSSNRVLDSACAGFDRRQRCHTQLEECRPSGRRAGFRRAVCATLRQSRFYGTSSRMDHADARGEKRTKMGRSKRLGRFGKWRDCSRNALMTRCFQGFKCHGGGRLGRDAPDTGVEGLTQRCHDVSFQTSTSNAMLIGYAALRERTDPPLPPGRAVRLQLADRGRMSNRPQSHGGIQTSAGV